MGLRDLTDAELLAAVADRDSEGISVLYDRYGGIAFGVALKVLTDRGAAEDVVQEAFLSIWRQAGSFDTSKGTARTWLLTVVRNRAVDRLRASRNRLEKDRTIEGMENQLGVPDVWNEVSAGLDRDSIRGALTALPAEQREVIEMAYFSGLTHVEIADRLTVPLGTVKGRMRIGLRKMRALLEPTERAGGRSLAESW